MNAIVPNTCLTQRELDDMTACFQVVTIVGTPDDERRAALRRLAEIREAAQERLPSTQKARWAAKAARYRGWADKADAAAAALSERWAEQRKDIAFLTQPGRIIARERFYADTQRAYELTQKAKTFRERAGNLERLATTNAGDAAARHKAEDKAVISTLAVGDTVDCVYGRVQVVKINRKSLLVQGRFGNVKIDAHLCKKVA